MRVKLAFFILVSLVFLLASWVVDAFLPVKGPLTTIFVEALRTLGSTGLAVAALNFWIETEDWRQYFEKRIKSIVIEQDYFKNLDDLTIKMALRNLMKARFKGAIIDKDDAFLDHFEANILKYIGSPFREDVVAIVDYESQDEDTWIIRDRVEYICRKMGQGIQDVVSWDVGEFLDIQEVEVLLYLPETSGYAKPVVLISSATDVEAISKLKGGIKLTKYREIDKIKIEIIAKYLKDKSDHYAWCMAYPSKNVDVSINFPNGYKVTTDVFLSREKNVIENEGQTYSRVIYKGWLLPQENGLAWQVKPRQQS